MKNVTVSAPGKIHFMGEHAVVYGMPALLSSVNLRLTIYIEPTIAKKDIIITSESSRYIKKAIEITRKALAVTDAAPFQMTVTSDIPSGYHLGSSAAVAVAVVGALMQYWTGTFDKEKINEIAYEIEKVAHGNPSGGDNTTVTYGGFVLFQKKSETEKTFKQLSFSFPPALNHFFLIKTGKPESTKEMVELVRSRVDEDTARMQLVFNTNHMATTMMIKALQDTNEQMLLAGLRVGEKTLEDMGVVSEKVKSFISAIEKFGGAAKILGGGGRKDGVGYILCYVHKEHTNKKNEIEGLLRQHSYTLQEIRLGEEGVRVEEMYNV